MRKLMCFVALAAAGSSAFADGSSATAPATNSSASSTVQTAPGGILSTEINAATPVGSVRSSASASTSGLDSSTKAVGFTRIDADGDGTISRKEAVREPALMKKFGSLDLNHDGKIDSMEFAAFEASGSANTDLQNGNGSDTGKSPKR